MKKRKEKEKAESGAFAGRVDALKKLRNELAKREAVLEPLKRKISAEEEALLEVMVETKTESVRGKFGRASVVRQLVPTIEDQRRFEAYVAKHKAFDLYQRRLNTNAWRDRIDAGQVVPGIKGHPRVSLRVS